MPTPEQLEGLKICRGARDELATAERQSMEALADVASQQAALDAALREGRAAEARAAAVRLDDARRRSDDAGAARRDAIAALAGGRKAALGAGSGTELLSAAHPLLLLPVRLETRLAWDTPGGDWTFEASASAPTRLLIRIFSDTVHLDGHVDELTDAESQALLRLRKRLDAARDRVHLDDAWSEAIASVGPARAAWLGELIRRGVAPGRRAAATTRPACARLLPDRWVARVHLDDGSVHVARSRPVAEPLAAGLAADAVAWMTDFAAALKVGMALVVAGLPAGLTAARQVMVFGVCGTLDPHESAAALDALLDAHHYTDGLELLAPGTATNSIPGERAGWNARPRPEDLVPLLRRRFAIGLRPDPLLQPGDGSDGSELVRQLGTAAETFAWVPGADGRDGDVARHLRALMASAVRRPLATLLRDGVLGEATLDELLQWAVQHLQPQGPLPALRIGAQPYGLLPVRLTGLEPSQPDGVAERGLPVLAALRRQWLAAADALPWVGNPGPDPGATLVKLLQREPVARSVAWRPALGPQLAAAALGPKVDAAVQAARRAAAAWLDGLGAPAAARSGLVNALHLEFAPAMTVPWVQPPGVEATDPQSMAASLERAAATPPDRLLRMAPAEGPWPRSLLFALARAAILERCDALARERLVAHGADASRWDDEDVPSAALDPLGTPLRRLQAPDPIDPLAMIAFHLSELGRDAAALADLRGALRALARRPPRQVEELLRGALGLFSHRLDAWFTGLASERLDALRAAPATERGLHIGAWGVVQDIRRAPRRAVPGEPGLFVNPFNDGYIHAPSAAHAATAAVLRSVHRAHAAVGDGSAFAVDLSSARVREALALQDGVREGQGLPALIGYRLERELMSARLPRLIAPLRAVAPLVAHQLTPGTESADTVAASTVIDGLRLLEAAGYDGRNAPQAATLLARQASLPRLDADETAALQRVLDAAADAVDALADLSLAEGVYQAVQGNPVRTGAALASLAGAPVPAPDPEVARTPRSGVGVTHRLVVLLGALPAGRAWPQTPRAAAEPRLDAWARAALPAPSAMLLQARYRDADGSVAATVGPISLQALHEEAARLQRPECTVGALDFVLQAEPLDEPARTPLALRLAALLDLKRPPAAGDAEPELMLARPSGATAAQFGLGEVLEIARQLRVTIGRGRALEGSDLAPHGAAAGVSALASDLAARAAAAASAFAAMRGALQAASATAVPAELRRALLAADAFGLPGAAVQALHDPPGPQAAARRAAQLAALQAQAAAVQAEAGRRAAELMALPAASAATVAGALERLRLVFGPAFVALPILDPAAELRAPFEAPRAPDLGADGDLRAWLARAALVREACGDLDAVLAHADAQSAVDSQAPAPAMHVAQLGGAAGERWVGRVAAAGASIPGGRISVVALTPEAALPAGAPLAGLVLDEWVEVVPAGEETTSVAFHFDAPGATAPQAMLLAVPPRSHPAWSENDVAAAITEAAALARMRLVDAEDLTGVGQLLPLFVTTESPRGEAVGLAVGTLTEPAR